MHFEITYLFYWSLYLLY